MKALSSRCTRPLGLAVAAASLVAAVTTTAGIVVEDKPVSLLTKNVIMQHGQPFVRLADLARALGGTGRYDPVKARYEIQPGASGVLVANPGLLAALGPGGDPEHAANIHAGSQSSLKLGIGGQDVMIDDEEHLLLRPGDPAISLRFLARLLGGQARLDSGKGMWVLPPGGPGSPLRFR